MKQFHTGTVSKKEMPGMVVRKPYPAFLDDVDRHLRVNRADKKQEAEEKGASFRLRRVLEMNLLRC